MHRPTVMDKVILSSPYKNATLESHLLFWMDAILGISHKGLFDSRVTKMTGG
jgi:hypothetical protein